MSDKKIFKGIDVSSWQGTIDWNKVKQSGVDFAMLRSSFGWEESQIDARFERNYTEATKAGVPVGVYHYSYATSVEDAKKEAKLCLRCLHNKTFGYPIAYDMEESRTSKLGKEKVSEIAKAFCETLEEAGYYVCIYANKHWLETYFTDEIFKNYDIWLAQWAEKPTFDKAFGLWQSTSNGRVDGIAGRVDLDESYKNYPNIMKHNSLNGFNTPETPEPVKPNNPATGTKVILKNTALYVSATAKDAANYLSGTFYVYDGAVINGRVRITNSSKNVGRTPISKFVTGFINVKDI